jgi:hypothetical protein
MFEGTQHDRRRNAPPVTRASEFIRQFVGGSYRGARRRNGLDRIRY